MTMAWLGMSAVNTFVTVNVLPLIVTGLLVAVMTPVALTVVAYGSVSIAAGGRPLFSPTQSVTGLVHRVEPQYVLFTVASVSSSSLFSMKLTMRAPIAGFTANWREPNSRTS